MAKPLDPIVSARVPEEIKDEIEQAARAAGVTRSDFIKSALITTVRMSPMTKGEMFRLHGEAQEVA